MMVCVLLEFSSNNLNRSSILCVLIALDHKNFCDFVCSDYKMEFYYEQSCCLFVFGIAL